MKTSAAASVPTRAQYAALRAWLQGVRPAAAANRWLSADPDAEWTDLEALRALRALRAIRAKLAQLALRHGREPLAKLLSAGTHGAAAVDALLKGLRELERLGSPAPAPKHAVQLWFAAPLARRLSAAGFATLGELVTLANNRGRAWWRRIPRVGRKHPTGTVGDGVDDRGGKRYRIGSTLADAGRCSATFQGSSSSMRLTGWSAMRSMT